MSITMTAKHQVTIPKKIAEALSLKKGTLFDVKIAKNRIELIPLETIEKIFTEEEYQRMEKIFVKERGKEKRISKKFIAKLKNGEI